jgi:predicted membrane protein (TIGR00267 family)
MKFIKDKYDEVFSRGMPYIINTLFDAVFTLLGIIVGGAFGSTIDIRTIIGTMLTASFSLGVSSGFSVYEAESLQEEKRIGAIEEALLTDLEDTLIIKNSRTVTVLSALLVFFTPLIACFFNLIPLFFVFFGFIKIERGTFLTIGVDLSLIFLSGLAFGGENRLLKGVRMTLMGVLIFLAAFFLNNII